MSERIGFHGNMVLWARNNLWNGLALFGQSVHGKTPFSYACAHRLISEGFTPACVKVFDDGYNLREGNVSYLDQRTGGAPDLLGIRDGLERELIGRGENIDLLHPRQDVEFPLNIVTVWLLLFTHEEDSSPLNGEPYKKERCTYDNFVSILMKTNPLWITGGQTETTKQNMVCQGLNRSWTYYKITREQQIDYSLQQKIIHGRALSAEEMSKIDKDRTIILNLVKEVS